MRLFLGKPHERFHQLLGPRHAGLGLGLRVRVRVRVTLEYMRPFERGHDGYPALTLASNPDPHPGPPAVPEAGATVRGRRDVRGRRRG